MTAMAHSISRDVDKSSSVTRIQSFGWLFAVPAALLLTILLVAPLLLVLGLSFTNYSLGVSNWSFTGLANYAALFTDARALKAVAHTAIYVAVAMPVSVIVGLVLALLIQKRRTFRHAYEIIFFLPATSTFISMAIVWQFLLHGRIGPINNWLVAFGLRRIDFLTDPAVALVTLSLIGAWQLVGQTTVLFLAGLASIPQDICDAAELDGMDDGWDRFLRITFPMLAPTTLFVVVTTTITTFQAFDAIAALTKGGPAGSTETLLYRIYLEAYQYTNMGYAAALSVVFLGFIVLFSLAQIFIADRRIHY